MSFASGRIPILRRWDRAVLTGEVVLILVLYYVVPFEYTATSWQVWARWIVFALGICLVCLSMLRAARRQGREDPATLPLRPPILIAVCGIALFALADHGVALVRPGEFVGLETRTDALYFALTTPATVGYGDIHAQGQWARGLFIAQMIFNVAVIAGAARLVASRLRARGHGDPR
ncbi:potassium channel family protein [Nocardiopsis sp. N85]|uniref:potassium channel family protein n=1 Tax=Nocardiopsis sp. N85 TaxID=3029400 RepID=UPI00237F6390|nr:potassium channel family protein [Nocardiopsis sp. N85]MDE3722574.1 potassium channel family protein [Nocardiopsis sp. N85]